MAQARIFYQQDCDINVLKGKRVAIIGYGSQGHAHALNLKESGVDVVVGLYEGSKSWAKAEQQGLTVMTTEEAAKTSDIIMILIPDEKQAALSEGDFDAFLSLINESGDSSFKYLQNIYASSAPNEQGLSLALYLAKQALGGEGACRVHGGGFAGTIQAFVPEKKLEAFKAEMERVFGEGSCYVLSIRPVGGVQIDL